MNQIRLEPRSQVGEHQQASPEGRSDQSQASRALLGTVGAIPFAGSAMEATGSGFPTPEQMLLGQPARPKRIET